MMLTSIVIPHLDLFRDQRSEAIFLRGVHDLSEYQIRGETVRFERTRRTFPQ